MAGEFVPPTGVFQKIADGAEGLLVGETATGLWKVVKDAAAFAGPSDIPAQGEQSKGIGGKYKYEYLSFPTNLGVGTRHPYYMTFYINTQDLSHFNKGKSQGPPSTIERNARQSTTLAKNITGTGLGFGRKTHRTVAAIRLYMPDTLSWSYENSFRAAEISGIPLTGTLNMVASIPALGVSQAKAHHDGSIMGILASLEKSPAARSVAGEALEVAGNGLLGPGGGELALSAAGIAINPQVDVIYQSPTLRTFNFDFMFAPRSKKEAENAAKIIHLFKFHSAPEALGNGIGIGRYFVPPSEFDIQFSVNSMGRISTCVLQSVTVDYAPSGAAFYADNRPVGTRLTLHFRELEFMTKELIQKGF